MPIKDAEAASDPTDRVTKPNRANSEARLFIDLALALSQADSLELALTVVLQTVCEAAGWAVAEAWVPEAPPAVGPLGSRGRATAGLAPDDADLRLARGAVWALPDRRFQQFITQGSGIRFAPGEGLPGAAWQRGEPLWENPLSGSEHFTRAPIARAAGLRAAVAIPIFGRGELVAVMSCYLADSPGPDAGLTEAAIAAASQIGPLIQQKKAEEALRDAEAQLTGTISIATDAIISIDESRRISLFNWGAERIFGYQAEEVLGQSLDMLLPEDLRTRHAGEIARFATSAPMTRRMGERSTIVGRRKNGEIFPAEAAISRYMASGRWTFTVIMRDITDRRRTEEGLRLLVEVGALLGDLLHDQMALQRAAARAVPTLGDACVIDLVENDHIVTAAVAATDQAWGRTIQEARDRSPLRWDVETPAIDAMRNRCTVMPDNSGTLTIEDGLRASSLPEVSSLLVAPLLAHDRVLGAVTFAMKTDGRRHDPSFRTLAEEFANRVALAVDNAAAYQRVRQAVGARDETLAVVSHDLRNPLSAITMCLSALRETPPPSAETTTDLLGSVQEATALMSRIIQDLLDVASMDSGRLSLERQVESIGPLLERVEAMFRVVADERGIALVLEHSGLDALPRVNIDAERIEQVLANLLNNALKFTDAGGIVRIAAISGPGKITVTVSDTGPGIAPEDLPHIFDRFWHGRRRTKIRSTGLGLAISRGIIQAHGARIWAESTVGQGTTLSFDLPAATSSGA